MINSLFRLKTFFLSLLVISSTVSATPESCCELVQETTSYWCSQPLFETKVGYFFFSDSKMRKVYSAGGVDIQLGISHPLWNPTSRWSFNAYGAVEYFNLHGKSINGRQNTSIWAVPINIGLKPVYAINANTQYYFGIGPRFFHLSQHNHSCAVYKKKSKNGVGFFLNTGFNYIFCNYFVVDIFGEYSYAKMHFHSDNSRAYTRNIQTGGFTFGGAFGYEF